MASSVTTAFVRKSATLVLLFITMYYGSNFIAAFRPTNVVAFEWERTIPFVPALYFVYFSALLLPFVLLSYFTSELEVAHWAHEMTGAIVTASLVFLVLPTSQFGMVGRIALSGVQICVDIIAGRHNLFPSLHVALSAIIVAHILRHEPRSSMRLVFIIWLTALVGSTIFTRQHNITDVIGGLAIALAVPRVSRKLFDTLGRSS